MEKITMIDRVCITTGKRVNPPRRGLSLILLVIAAWVPAWVPAFAHGGFDHIRGTVVKVANNVLTVKADKGNIDVKLSEQTDLTRNGQKAQLADLKPGVRVVVDVPEGGKDPIAHSVKIGVITAPIDSQGHKSRK